MIKTRGGNLAAGSRYYLVRSNRYRCFPSLLGRRRQCAAIGHCRLRSSDAGHWRRNGRFFGEWVDGSSVRISCLLQRR